MTESQEPDWVEAVMAELPEKVVKVEAHTHITALQAIKVAAYNRRMGLGDFIGRAAAAVAVYDSDGSITWDSLMEKEPPLRDLRRRRLPRRRLRGTGFGGWRITGMDE